MLGMRLVVLVMATVFAQAGEPAKAIDERWLSSSSFYLLFPQIQTIRALLAKSSSRSWMFRRHTCLTAVKNILHFARTTQCSRMFRSEASPQPFFGQGEPRSRLHRFSRGSSIRTNGRLILAKSPRM